jgi:hypothetical protein
VSSDTSASIRFAHDFSRIPVSSPAPARLQAKLMVNTPGDIYEQEADRIAEQVTRMPEAPRQQITSVARPLIQRDVLTSTPLYELQDVGGSPQQVRTTRTMRGVTLPVSYDSATGIFTVTFRLAWIFPHSWPDARRNDYVQRFEASVRGIWNDRFLLTETRAPRRTAHVQIGFDNLVIPQMAAEGLELVQLGEPAASGRWRMDVRNLTVVEGVNRSRGVVHLGERSMERIPRSDADLRSTTSFSFSGTGGNRRYNQAPAPHEFGHMIGLGDEYLEDAGEPIPTAVRGHINARIMNVGEEVTADAYAPFAAWLSEITSSTWRVGHRVSGSAPRPRR